LIGSVIAAGRVYQPPPPPSQALPIAWKRGIEVGVPDSITGATNRKDAMRTRMAASLVMDRSPPCIPCRDASLGFERDEEQRWGHDEVDSTDLVQVSASIRKSGSLSPEASGIGSSRRALFLVHIAG
jgi:hypothetical protein